MFDEKYVYFMNTTNTLFKCTKTNIVYLQQKYILVARFREKI